MLLSILNWTTVTLYFSIFCKLTGSSSACSKFCCSPLQPLKPQNFITQLRFLISPPAQNFFKCIHYKILSITYECTISNKTTILCNMPTIQTISTTHSSSFITLTLTILLIIRLAVDPSIILLLSNGMLYLTNFICTILVT
jgi:hypothetical protein